MEDFLSEKGFESKSIKALSQVVRWEKESVSVDLPLKYKPLSEFEVTQVLLKTGLSKEDFEDFVTHVKTMGTMNKVLDKIKKPPHQDGSQ